MPFYLPPEARTCDRPVLDLDSGGAARAPVKPRSSAARRPNGFLSARSASMTRRVRRRWDSEGPVAPPSYGSSRRLLSLMSPSRHPRWSRRRRDRPAPPGGGPASRERRSLHRISRGRERGELSSPWDPRNEGTTGPGDRAARWSAAPADSSPPDSTKLLETTEPFSVTISNARNGLAPESAAPRADRGVMASPTTEPTYEAQPQNESHLWDYVHVLLRRRRLVLAVFVAIVGVATLRSLLTTPVYQATAQLLIERQNPNVLNFQGVSQDNQGWGIDDYYQTQYKLLQSRSLARRVIEHLNLLNDPEFGGPRDKAQIDALLAQPPGQSPELEGAIGGFIGSTSVQPVRNSRLVNVSVVSGRPEFAATAANALAQLYIQQSLDLRFQTSSEAGQWLGTQIEEQRKKAEDADRRLQELKRQEGLVNIEERRTLLDQRLKELGTALNERKTERLQKEALYRQMAGASNPEELPEVMRSGVVQNLRIELANLERQQAQLLERYLDQHPEVVKVKNQIQDTRAKLRSEAQRVIRSAENDYKASAAQEASISSALESAKQETLELASRAVTYDSQKREVDAAKQVLDSLMSRAKQTDVESELKPPTSASWTPPWCRAAPSARASRATS